MPNPKAGLKLIPLPDVEANPESDLLLDPEIDSKRCAFADPEPESQL